MIASPATPQTVLRGCLVGANPIIWSNDDFPELAGDVPLDTILADMRASGYAGSELGHAYPRSPGPLADALGRHGLRLASGWHSTYLASRELGAEETTLRQHLALLRTLGTRVAIVAECTKAIHGSRETALGYGAHDRPTLTDAEWARLTAGMQRFVEIAAAEQMTLAYHHHVGTVIQTGAELDRLLAGVAGLGLLLDPGHLAFAGVDPLAVMEEHGRRIVHVHLKSAREGMIARARREGWSFCRAVSEGVFTIPGDGVVDFPAIFTRLAALNYQGWLIVEAEEDPARAPALEKARNARAYVRRHAGI